MSLVWNVQFSPPSHGTLREFMPPPPPPPPVPSAKFQLSINRKPSRPPLPPFPPPSPPPLPLPLPVWLLRRNTQQWLLLSKRGTTSSHYRLKQCLHSCRRRLVQRAYLFHMFSCDLAALAAPVSAPAAEGSLATLQQTKKCRLQSLIVYLGWYSETRFHIGMDRNFVCFWRRYNCRSQVIDLSLSVLISWFLKSIIGVLNSSNWHAIISTSLIVNFQWKKLFCCIRRNL